MSYLPGWFPAADAVAQRSVTVVNTTHAEDSVDRSTFTFSSQSLGTASDDRRIVVGIHTGGTGTISSVSIGGVSATRLTRSLDGSGNELCALWIAAVPTGTTGDVVVVWSTTTTNCAIGVWAVYGLVSNTAFAVASTGTSATDPASVTIDIPQLGGVVGFARCVTNTNPFTWTGLTEDFDDNVPTDNPYTGASDEFSAGETGRTVSADNTTAARMSVASFGPG
jgi:hypothetical protein